MSFARGRFGIEYTPRRADEPHPFRWLVFAFVLLAVVSFLCARGCRRDVTPDSPPDVPSAPTPPETPPPPDTPAQPVARNPPPSTQTPPSTPSPQPVRQPTQQPPAQAQSTPRDPSPPQPPTGAEKAVSSKSAKAATQWLEAANSRPPDETALLARLADAERLGKVTIVRDTLEKLRRRTSMADLDDQFARRLGAINSEMLFAAGSKERDGWTTFVEVKRGDNAQRIAREHGTTLAAVLKLNALKDANKIRSGDKLRLLNFPHAELVVHTSLRFADLSLNKRFFKRYDVANPPKTNRGYYPVTREEGPMDRFNSLGLKFSQADREELAILLAPGSRIIVSPQ